MKLDKKSKIKVYIASDHAGYEMKQKLINSNELDFIDFVDLGTNSSDSVDYPDYAEKLGESVINNNANGIAICGTGIGISVALNKINGIYTAAITDTNTAKLAKKHNNLNVLSLSGRFSSVENNIDIIKAFFSEEFETRHQDRINKIKKIESNK